DDVEKVFLIRRPGEYLYRDGGDYVVMDPESFEQTHVPISLVPDDRRGFMVPNLRLHVLTIDEKVVQVELPQTCDVEVTEAPESARGDTATAITKLVTIETGAQVRVPGHIRKGDRIRVRIEDGQFRGRAG